MRLKINCNMLADAEGELRDLAARLQQITDEIAAAQRALLSTGDTFRLEARAMDSRRRAIEQQISQTYSLSEALARVIELYADCERNQRNSPLEIGSGLAEILHYVDSAVPINYISEEQFSKSYGDLISPLVGVLE